MNLHSSSPADFALSASNGNTATGTSASFTPPLGALVVVKLACDTTTSTASVATITPSGFTISQSQGGSAGFVQHVNRPSSTSGATGGHVVIASGVVTASASGTIAISLGSLGSTQNGARGRCFVEVWTGADTSSSRVDAVNEGSSTANAPTVTVTSTGRRTLGHAMAGDWNALGTPTTTDEGTGFTIASVYSGISVRKAANQTAPDVISFNVDAPGTSAADWNWVAVAFKVSPFRSLSSVAYASRTNMTISAPPSVVDGDNLLLFLFIFSNSGTYPDDPTPPSGFTAIVGPTQLRDAGAGRVKVGLYRKIASSESGSYSVTHATNNSAAVLYVSNGGTVNGLTLSSSNQNYNGSAWVPGGTTATVSGLTTPANDSAVVYFRSEYNLLGSLTPPSGTTPTFTERYDPDDSLLYVADGWLDTAGATGDKTQTATAEVPWLGILAAIGPLGTPDPGGGDGTVSISGSAITPGMQVPSVGTAVEL